MTGLEKILEHIKNDTNAEVDKIRSQAKQEAEGILEAARSEASKEVRSIQEQAKENYEATLRKGGSAAGLKEKRMILEAKQLIIEEMLQSTFEVLKKLPEEEYFEIILKMIKKYALKKEGKILFSESDLNRMPGGFNHKISKALKDMDDVVLTMSDETRPINGGFILQYGDIEENCSFEALFSAARETLQDKVGALLFD